MSLFAHQVQALAQVTETDVSTLTRSIVDKEIELAKLNLHVSPHPSIWYNRRWQLAAITNNSLTSTGAFITAGTAYHYQERPLRVPKNVAADGSMLRGTANFVTVGECLLEFGLDGRNYIKDKHDHRDLRHARAQAITLKRSIDQLIKQREALIAAKGFDEKTARRLALEGTALEDIRDAEASHFVF